MAAADVLRSPQPLITMPPTQRAPLADLPQAVNSPARNTATKRTRDGKTIFDADDGPPAKRVQLDRDLQQERENIPPQIEPRTPQKPRPARDLDTGHGEYTEAAAKERERVAREESRREDQAKLVKAKAAYAATMQKIERQKQKLLQQQEIQKWQRFYEKQFPNFRFYFDHIPEDMRRTFSREIRELKASEDRFFSRSVTHVVTTRPIPKKDASPVDEQPSTSQHQAGNGTINPSLLEKRAGNNDELSGANRSKSVFDSALSRRSGQANSPGATRPQRVDVLAKAMDLGIKIWSLDKFERVMRTMFEDDEGVEYVEAEVQAPNVRPPKAPKKQPEALSKLMKREEQTKNAAYDSHALLKTELVPLTEPYLYVRCMNEKTRPMMLRQFTKVAKPADGAWPQFRPVTQGKCPFIIEDVKSRRENEARRERARKQERRGLNARAAEKQARNGQANLEQETNNEQGLHRQATHLEQPQSPRAENRGPLATLEQAPTTRARAAHFHKQDEENQENHEQDDDATEEDPALQADEDATTDAPQTTPTEGNFSKEIGEPNAHSRHTSFDLMAPPAALPRPNPGIGCPGGEPLASGIQRSGATAAIRSTMGISSAAAQPGLRAGTTRDMHSLQRRVLDRYSTGSGSALGMSAPLGPPTGSNVNSGHSGLVESHRVLDIAGRARTEQRAAKMKAQKMIHMQNQPAHDKVQQARAARASQARALARAKTEPKPGFCENCKDKFDDFEEHIDSRKHRKFATNKDNWTEIDALLALLERPKKRKASEEADREAGTREESDLDEQEFDEQHRRHKRTRHE